VTSTEYQQLIEFLGRQFAAIDRRFDDMGGQLGGQIANLHGQVTDLHGELADMGDRLAELRHDVLGHFDEVYRRLERLEQEYHAITQALRRIEAGLADEHAQREILERDLSELKQRVAALQTRIEEIEQRLGR
jgi:predicted  nucleic acid-binding Zn-ribbon protein